MHHGDLIMVKKKRTKTILIVIAFIVIISVGTYLGLAYPFPVHSQPVSLSGILSTTDFTMNIAWPNSQMQVIVQLTSVSAFWGYDIRDASNNLWFSEGSIDTSTTIKVTPWQPASGVYTITVTCVGNLDGTVTVLARGVPFVTP